MIALIRRIALLFRVLLAARAMRNAPDEQARNLARVRLSELMGNGRGLTMKVGQALSRSDADPLHILTTSAPPLAPERVHAVLARELGATWPETLTELAPGARAASLGQVHRAYLPGAGEVAVKVQYPDVEAAVVSELRLAGWLPSLGPVRRHGFDLAEYKRELCARALAELDYREEALRQREFRANVHVHGLVVPEVFERLCTRRVLVQRFEPGERLEQAATWAPHERLQLARTVLEMFFCSVFVTGRVHADPHPGNWAFRQRNGAPQVVLYDFGSVVDIDEKAASALLSIILAVRERQPLDYLAAYAALGFDRAKLSPIEGRLQELSEVLFEPFTLQGAMDPSVWNVSARVERLLGIDKWYFRAAGPAQLFLVLRALVGISRILTTLSAPLPWFAVLRRAVGQQALEQARGAAPPARWAAAAQPLPQGAARALRVLVKRGEEIRADLHLPALEARRLSQVVPGHVQRRVRKAGYDLRTLQLELETSGYTPRDLLSWEADGTTGRVWLE